MSRRKTRNPRQALRRSLKDIKQRNLLVLLDNCETHQAKIMLIAEFFKEKTRIAKLVARNIFRPAIVKRASGNDICEMAAEVILENLFKENQTGAQNEPSILPEICKATQ